MIFEKKNIHLLIADDDQGMRDMLTMELTGQGYQVTTAVNGRQALDFLGAQKFDLVITDLRMPEMDGMKLLENIKGLDPELEVIIATGQGTVETAVAAMKNGAYDFILKPFNLRELNTLIEKALEKKKLKTIVALYEASSVVFTTLELDELLKIILERMGSVLGADESSIMLLNQEKKLYIAASVGMAKEIAEEVRVEVGGRVAGAVAKERQARLFINGLEKYPEFKDVLPNSRIQSSIVCPIICQGEVLGVLNISRTKNKKNFSMLDLQSVILFTSQAALAIQNARLYQNLQQAYRKIEKTQAELIQSEKLASIGRLVAGVAHELNNPLTSVIGYSQLVLESNNLEDIHRQLPIIASQAIRCSTIVKDLLLFSRTQKPVYQEINLFSLLDEVLKGMSPELEKNKVEVNKIFPPEPVFISADLHLLKRVFTNLLTNAHQALEETGGKRTVEIVIQKHDKTEKVSVSFKDNGSGIPQEIIHKIFDPFYTTKDIGKGTGLGLSLAYGIIKEHGGSIIAQSELGKSTLITIELPVKADRESGNPRLFERPCETNFKLAADAKILLVEDEESIANFISGIFKDQNYNIELASNGQTALEKIESCDYDLILTDYRMPKISGIELYEKTIKLKPNLKQRFLFITGSTEFMRNIDAYFKSQQLPFLLKPFTKPELVSAVNSAVKKLSEISREA